MKREEYLGINLKSDIEENKFGPMPSHFGILGNSKIGPITSFNTLAGHDCPGKTEYCSKICYDIKSLKVVLGGYKQLGKAAWSSYLIREDPAEYFELVNFEVMVCGTETIRIHVGGDFMSPEHVLIWEEIAEINTHKVFFCYTRSWQIPEIRERLENLRKKDNVTVFASIDPDIEDKALRDEGLKSWRKAYMIKPDKEKKPNSIICPEQLGKVKSCVDCRWCFNPKLSNTQLSVSFKEH